MNRSGDSYKDLVVKTYRGVTNHDTQRLRSVESEGLRIEESNNSSGSKHSVKV